MEQPISSPDLTPSDFHEFPKIKEYLRKIHFRDDETLIEANEWFANQDKTFFSLPSLHQVFQRLRNEKNHLSKSQ